MEWGQQFTQLPMFMSAREITQSHQSLFGDRKRIDRGLHRENDAMLYRRKYEEAKDSTDDEWSDFSTSHRDHMQKYGVTSPVHLGVTPRGLGGFADNPGVRARIQDVADMTQGQDRDWRPVVAGGHHRIGTMLHEQPDRLMPVMWHEGKHRPNGEDNLISTTDALEAQKGPWRQYYPQGYS